MLLSGLGAITSGALSKLQLLKRVAPLAAVQALGRRQRLVDGESPIVLNVGVDERGVALVAVEAADAASRAGPDWEWTECTSRRSD